LASSILLDQPSIHSNDLEHIRIIGRRRTAPTDLGQCVGAALSVAALLVANHAPSPIDTTPGAMRGVTFQRFQGPSADYRDFPTPARGISYA
jgi:hypothetical protein